MSAPIPIAFPTPQVTSPTAGGIQFKEAAPLICGVVDNGVAWDDPRVMVRANEATKIILDYMIPVGGMVTANITAINTVLVLPPEMENVIEAHPAPRLSFSAPGFTSVATSVFNDPDNTQAWYEIVNQSVYLDPNQAHDNPLIDRGLWPDTNPAQPLLRRVYEYPGLLPVNAPVTVTGAKRYIPIDSEDDYLIVQNIEALKLVILSIERFENNAPDEGKKYRTEAFEMLQAEVKKHILDPRNYMFRKTGYMQDLQTFPPGTLGWTRANIALDVDAAMKTGKIDLTWSINKAEQRLMQRMISKDCITQIQADVTGGVVYFPVNVGSVLAIDLNGLPIPIRSQFFETLENGPGMFEGHPMLIDQGDEFFAGTKSTRRKYKLIADCTNLQTINAVCKLRWVPKEPDDLMTIKNYEVIRLMMTAKFLEEQEDWKNAAVNQQQAYDLLERELREYLSGIQHVPQIQTFGFGLGDVGRCTL